MKRFHSVSLVLIGAALGCGAATAVPTTWAAAAPGEWSCHDTAQFPSAEKSGMKAASHTEGMNNVAATASAGTVVAISRPTYTTIVCVKH